MPEVPEWAPFGQEQKKPMKPIIMMSIALAVVLLAIVTGAVVGIRGLMNQSVGAGDQYIPFSGETVYGETFHSESFAGDVIVIDFWATWCPPCRAEVPTMINIQEDLASRGVQVIGVSADNDQLALRRFMETNEFNYPVIFGGADKILQDYQVRMFPTYVIVDRDGTIYSRYSIGDLRAKLEKLLSR